MQYDLFVLGDKVPVPLTSDQFSKYDKARTRLLAIKDIEFSLDLVVESYHEFIDDLLRLSTRYMFSENDIFKIKIEYFITINRRISNYFSTFYEYCEHTRKNLCRGFDRKYADKFKGLLEKTKQDNRVFALAYELRHSAQHLTNPVGLIRYGGSWIDQEEQENALLITRIIPYMQVSEFLKDKENLRTILEQLVTDNSKDCIDLRYIIAESIAGIICIHDTLMAELDNDLDEIKQIVNQLLSIPEQGMEKKSLYIRKFDNQDKIVQSSYVSSIFIEELNILKSKHKSLSNIDKWGFDYVVKRDEFIYKRLMVS